MPAEAAQPFCHSATMVRLATSMATVVACQRCVYARPRVLSMTIDSGPLVTATTAACTGAAVGSGPA